MSEPIRPRMLAAMADMGGYTKDNTANAGKYTYSYEDFAQVDAIVTPALAAHGLAYRQAMQGFSHELNCPERLQCLVTYICDVETGEEQPIDARAIVVSADPQANGSAETYARRYALKTAFRLTESDDDGKAAKDAATGKTAPQKEPQARRGRYAKVSELTEQAKSLGIDMEVIKKWTAKNLGPDMSRFSDGEMKQLESYMEAMIREAKRRG